MRIEKNQSHIDFIGMYAKCQLSFHKLFFPEEAVIMILNSMNYYILWTIRKA